jgi:hypothetical protein
MKRIILTLLIATFFCLTTFSFAQERVNQPTKAKPIRIDKIPTGKLLIPEDISVLEAKSYEFLVATPGKVTVNLYDNSNKQVASVELQDSTSEKTLFYKITENNREEWLKIQTQEHQNSILFSATSSAGREMTLEAQIVRNKNSRKFRVKGITLLTESGLKTLSLSESNFTESRLAIENAVQVEEQKFFATPALQKLKEFMRNFGKLRDTALNEWSGQAKITSCNNQESYNLTEEVELSQSPCSGTSTCFRMSTIVPVFTCTSTNDKCGGIFIIYDCAASIVCSQSCSDLNSCA